MNKLPFHSPDLFYHQPQGRGYWHRSLLPSMTEIRDPNHSLTLDGIGKHIAEVAQQSRQPVHGTSEKTKRDATPAAISQIVATLKVEPTEQLIEPPKVLSIESADRVGTIGTAGNFSLIIGAAKSRKSFMTAALIASYLNPRHPVLNCIQANPIPNQQAVLYFDTEQSRHHVLRSVKRMCMLSDIERPQGLHSYALRSLDTTKRLEAIEYLIEHTPNVGLVVIDGIRDLVFDINSAEEATNISTRLLRWTEQRNIHLLTVLHTNKGNLEARGHLGSELINKSETVMRVIKDQHDKSISIVTPEQCRDMDFEPFAFTINEQGLPKAVDAPVSDNDHSRRNQKRDSEKLTRDEEEVILRRAFEKDTYLGYAELKTNVIEAAQYFGKKLAQSKHGAEMVISRRTKDILRKEKVGGKGYPKYFLQLDKGYPI
ncbi:AAA family ATPase [Fibrivirga algicola]|uniref:AAA family ATPase n=1 Tax=Fibrivirga algicola TaxID=2950420 RepID=A0ABX0QHD8_9BACT|nr:AAA family ATPase [Fibrivirga algicola]NID10635.1 AAA family ATPase [Fibrivirga algicola]